MTYPNQVPTKKRKSNRLINLAENENGLLSYYTGFAGVIRAGVKGEKGCIEGLTPNYIRVICEGEKSLEGRIIDVKLKKAEHDHMSGVIMPQNSN